MRASTLIVSEASPLIALDQIQCLQVLPALFSTVMIPPAVLQEIPAKISGQNWLTVRAPSGIPAVLSGFKLDPGECEALALAAETEAELLIDERLGRMACPLVSVKFVGTAGLLVGAKEEGLIPAVAPLLRALRDDHRFWLSDTVYQMALREAGEA